MKFLQIADKQEEECPYKGYFISFFRAYAGTTEPKRAGWMIVINLPFSVKRLYLDPMDFTTRLCHCTPALAFRRFDKPGMAKPGFMFCTVWVPEGK